jgi:hypothetical protein
MKSDEVTNPIRWMIRLSAFTRRAMHAALIYFQRLFALLQPVPLQSHRPQKSTFPNRNVRSRNVWAETLLWTNHQSASKPCLHKSSAFDEPCICTAYYEAGCPQVCMYCNTLPVNRTSNLAPSRRRSRRRPTPQSPVCPNMQVQK